MRFEPVWRNESALEELDEDKGAVFSCFHRCIKTLQVVGCFTVSESLCWRLESYTTLQHAFRR